MIGKLIKIDKNGTKYYANYTCNRCGGAGGSDKWAHTGYTCYDCGGTGRANEPSIYKEYTEEYSAKLKEQREKRNAKLLAKRVEEFKANLNEKIQEKGFNADGKIYVVVGNTYPIKDELKAAGAKFKQGFNTWVFTEKNDKYPVIEIDYTEVLEANYEQGYFEWKSSGEIAKAIESKLPKQEVKISEYIGNVGDKLDAEYKLVGKFDYERHSFRGFGMETVFIFKFEDSDGNVLIWNTTTCPTKLYELSEGAEIKIKATIKGHNEYKGTKQTEIIRVKVA